MKAYGYPYFHDSFQTWEGIMINRSHVWSAVFLGIISVMLIGVSCGNDSSTPTSEVGLCDNAIDDDADGDTDCDDSDCAGDPACDTSNCMDADNDTYYAYDPANCPSGDDCDDGDQNIHPGAVEVCDDAVDNDCNGDIDAADTVCQSVTVADPPPSSVSINQWNGFLALGPTYLYFGYAGEDAGGGTNVGGVAMANKDGSNVQCIECDAGNPRELATDGSSVYWADVGNDQLKKAPLGGGAVTILWNGQMGFGPVAVDESHVYWFDEGSSAVMQANTDGSMPTQVATGQSGVNSIASDGELAYWTSQDRIMAQDLSGGSPATLASGQTDPKSIAVDSTHVYWASGAWNMPDKSVRRVTKAGGGVEILATFGGAWAIALDDIHVYCAGSGPNVEDNTIWRVLKAGGDVEILAADQPYPFDIVVDDTTVYWSSETDGGVDSITK